MNLYLVKDKSNADGGEYDRYVTSEDAKGAAFLWATWLIIEEGATLSGIALVEEVPTIARDSEVHEPTFQHEIQV